jgi:hypothetical protein
MMFAPLREPEDKGIHEDSRMVDGEKILDEYALHPPLARSTSARIN